MNIGNIFATLLRGKNIDEPPWKTIHVGNQIFHKQLKFWSFPKVLPWYILYVCIPWEKSPYVLSRFRRRLLGKQSDGFSPSSRLVRQKY